MVIGFTGTQSGMSLRQLDALAYILDILPNPQFNEFHHGDCIGADFIAAKMAKYKYYETHSHPPINESKRAFHNSNIIHEPKDYLARNHDIVDACELLIVAPNSDIEQLRSGTWATYRYAKKLKKMIHKLKR